MRENQGTGPRVRSLPARHGEKDQMAAKRVESFRVPCLDAGSTPATSTENQMDSINPLRNLTDCGGDCRYTKSGLMISRKL